MTITRSLRTGRVALVAALTVAGAFTVAGQPAAQAGGTPAAECPGGREFAVADPGDEPDPGPPVHLAAGFYAQTAAFWPPRSALLCRTESGRRQPGARIAATNNVGCPPGARELLVPDEIPASYDTPVVARSGVYLPAGWYTLASQDVGGEGVASTNTGVGSTTTGTAARSPRGSVSARGSITWTAVCWSRTAPPAPAPAPTPTLAAAS